MFGVFFFSLPFFFFFKSVKRLGLSILVIRFIFPGPVACPVPVLKRKLSLGFHHCRFCLEGSSFVASRTFPSNLRVDLGATAPPCPGPTLSM